MTDTSPTATPSVTQRLETMAAEAAAAGDTEVSTILTDAKTKLEAHAMSLWARIEAQLTTEGAILHAAWKRLI